MNETNSITSCSDVPFYLNRKLKLSSDVCICFKIFQ